jgi:hypothetical protein
MSPLVARADAPPVEVLCAVRHARRPFSNDGPQLVPDEVLEVAALLARGGDVLRLRLRDALTVPSSYDVSLHAIDVIFRTPPKGTHSVREQLVDVGVKSHPLVVWRALPTIPIAERLEGVMD